jgi:hypothetical protein
MIKFGYIPQYYKVTTNGSNLNLRSTASESAEIRASVPNGTIVEVNYVLQAVDGWIAVTYGNIGGYLSAQWVTPVSSSDPETPGTSDDENGNGNNSNKNNMFNLSENALKYIKIGAIGLGGCALLYGIYTIVKKPKTSTQPALNGVKRRKRRKAHKKIDLQ